MKSFGLCSYALSGSVAVAFLVRLRPIAAVDRRAGRDAANVITTDIRVDASRARLDREVAQSRGACRKGESGRTAD